VREATAVGGVEADEVEQLADALAQAPIAARQAEGDVGRDVEVREQRALLGDVAHAPALGGHVTSTFHRSAGRYVRAS
jgi:hypothetical protein